MRIETDLMNLASMLVQAGQLYAGSVEIVKNNTSVRSGGGNRGVKSSMRPFDIVRCELILVLGGHDTS